MIHRHLKRYFIFGLLITFSWILCEVFVGAFSLYVFNIRLWDYKLLPLVDGITSPIAWLLAFILITPIQISIDAYVRKKDYSRIIYTAICAAILGPLAEILVHYYFFEGVLGVTIYKYMFLPTFVGSGSVLSPLYYLTLAIHVPLTEKLLFKEMKREGLLT